MGPGRARAHNVGAAATAPKTYEVCVNEDTGMSDLAQHPYPQVRDALEAAMRSDRLTLKAVSQAIGGAYGPSTLSQFLSASYRGDYGAVAATLETWLRQRDEQQALGASFAQAPAYVVTPTAHRIATTITSAIAAQGIAEIIAPPGMGKTTALRHYRNTHVAVWLVTMNPMFNRLTATFDRISREVGVAGAHGRQAVFDAVLSRLAGTKGALIIDEAHHLDGTTIDALRCLGDEARIAIVFAGSEQLASRRAGRYADQMAQVTSRVFFPLRLTAVDPGDVDAVLAAWKITDPAVRRRAIEIAEGPGAIRTLTIALRLAATTAASERKPLSDDLLRRAYATLGMTA